MGGQYSEEELSPLLNTEKERKWWQCNHLQRRKWQMGCFACLFVVAVFGFLWFVLFGLPLATVEIASVDNSLGRQYNHSVDLRKESRLPPPFLQQTHPIVPQLISKTLTAPYPTNEWWTNLLISDSVGLNPGAAPVTVSPYTIQSTYSGLQVSYGDFRRIVTSTQIKEEFHADLTFSSLNSSNPNFTALTITNKEVIAYDELSVHLEFSTSRSQPSRSSYKAILVRGSPYITIEYTNSIPLLTFGGKSIYSINGKRFNSSAPFAIGKNFEVTINMFDNKSQARWLIFMPHQIKLEFHCIGGIVSASSSTLLSGVVRAAVLPFAEKEYAMRISNSQNTMGSNNELRKLLHTHANVYPISSSVSYSIKENSGANDESFLTFSWVTKSTTNGNLKAMPNKLLLMVAHPHQVDSFYSTNDKFGSKLVSKMQNGLFYRSVKGKFRFVLGNQWVLKENLTNMEFDSPRNPSSPEHIAKIKESLVKDVSFKPEKIDPYFFGKEVTRQARLSLIAHQLNDTKTRDILLEQVMEWMEPWLTGKNKDFFVYDTVWGGLCSKNGLKGVFYMTDFGNGWYSDHHFHYGYLIYTLAVVGRFQPQFIRKHQSAVLSLVRDIANPIKDDPYFPFARYFSWFDGHSFASGVFVLEGGKSQESVSEAINAYYGVYLLGKIMNDNQIRDFGRMLLAMEKRAAQTYWQMSSSSQVYEKKYRKNKMTGQVGSTVINYVTWFGSVTEDMHLINMIPFTPITEEFLLPEYIHEEYPVLLEQGLNRKVPPMQNIWRGYSYLDHAIIDSKAAWEEVKNITTFDDGSSETNSLFWIATRP